MKPIIILLLIAAPWFANAQNQHIHSFGLGYFGEILTHPGLVLEYEIEHPQSDRFSLISKSNLGYYNHARNHQAIFLEGQLGLKRNLNTHWFLENAIGIGVMLPWLNAPVYKVSDQGEVQESSKSMNPDFMPSFSLGIGYDFNTGERKNAVWLRPKIFWQYPYNTLPLPHIAMQIGYTHTFKISSK